MIFLSKSSVDLYPLELSTKKAAQQLRNKILKRFFKDEAEQTSDVENIDRINKTASFVQTLKQCIATGVPRRVLKIFKFARVF